MECIYCDYDWASRVEQPKECPRCKRRLDKTENYKMENKIVGG